MALEKMRANWTYDADAHAFYFAPSVRAAPPYLKQIEVRAIVDVAQDGSFAGVEIVDPKMPRPIPRD